MKKPLILTISLAAAVAVVCVSIGGYRIYKKPIHGWKFLRSQPFPFHCGKIIPLTA